METLPADCEGAVISAGDTGQEGNNQQETGPKICVLSSLLSHTAKAMLPATLTSALHRAQLI